MINEISLDSGIMTTQARPNGFETLLRISKATAGARDLPDLLRAVAYSLRDALDLDHFVVALVDEAAGRFTFPLWLEGDEARSVPPSDFHHDQSLLCLATRLGRPLANADAFALKHVNRLAPGLPLPASYLAVPLVSQAALGPVGGLVIGSSQVGAYGPDELDLLKIVASVVNLAAEKAQLRESASRYARSPEDVTRKREMDQMKDELVNVVSHELRTPLASVLGFAELLLTRDFPEAKRRQVIETIYKEAERLSALINEFLDLRRLESGALPFAFTPVNLAELAQSVVAHYALGQRQHDLQLDVPEALPLVHADPVQLGQVLRNLLDNAFKYSPNGGRVTLAARAMGDTVRVTVHDQGLGLPAGAIPRLFERFYRVDSSDRREIGGTGLGLSIVKEIIRAHGGQVWAESPGPGQGSTFGLALRLAVPVATVQATASTTAPKEPYVLIVEDDPGMVSLIQEHMQAANYRTAVVTQPAAALNLIRQRLPLGVVLDVCLPDPQQGWSLLEAIRQLHPASELPVITISVLDERDKALALGATEYLVKPFEPSQLVALLQRRPGREVLVVDDEAMILRLMRTILEKSGYRVQGVSNGRAALASLNRSAPDLMILDLMMPELDGFEVLARVRAHPAGRDLPVLVMTAKHLDRAERQKLKRFGAFLLTKSEYTTVRLRTAVERALRERWAASLSRTVTA